MHHRVLFVLCILFATCTAYCSTYFVDPNGNDTTGNGSITLPWKTLTPAVSAAVAGDTIYLRGGTYYYTTKVSISKGGSAGNYITIQNYLNEAPILDFSGVPWGTGTNRGIQLNVGSDYWHFKGFTIRYAPDNGLYSNASYGIFERLIAYGNEDTGINFLANSSGSPAYNQVINCDSYLNYDPCTHGGNADGFGAKGPTNGAYVLGPGNVFRGCRAWDNSDDGYDLWWAGNSVTIENCWAWRNGNNIWGDPGPWAGNGEGIKLGQGPGAHIITNCLSYYNRLSGFALNRSGGDTEPIGVTVNNCTGVRNQGQQSGGGSNLTNFNFPNPTTGAVHTLHNNISYIGTTSIGSLIVNTYNTWNSGFSVNAADFAGLDANELEWPRQADGNLPNISYMRLASTSELIDAGTDVGLPFCGSGPDLGYSEYCLSGNPPGPATSPNPTNGATGVSVTQDLSWTAGSGATSHDVYFGTTSPGTFQGNQTGTTFDTGTMAQGVTYYWRINEVNDAGTTIGTVWNFTTVPPPPPGPATSPTPASGATDVSTAQDLSWTAGSGAASHDVYFGTVNPPPFIINQAGTTYDTGTMAGSKTYYWRIDEKNVGGTTTGTVWNFTTGIAAPTFVAAGTAVSGISNITVLWPTHQAGDVALLFVESCGGQVATLGTPAGFAAVANSPQSTGTGTAGTRITVYWCRATSSTMASPVVTDPGDHAHGRILTFRNVISTGNPWDVTAGGTKASASASTTFEAVTTTVNNDLIVLAASRDNDSTTAAWSAWTNANLSGITEQSDTGTTQGNGGGIGVATGVKVTAGDTGQTTATVTSTVDGHMTIALKPEAVSPPGAASSPTPTDTAINVSLTQDLSWTAGSGAASHDVYFGTVNPPPSIGNQAGTTYDTGTMTYSTIYYWRIDEKNTGGTTTGTLWSFTTQSDTTPPAAPTGLTATAGYIPVILDWSNNSESDLAGYNVYRSTTSGSGYGKLNGTLLTDSNYIDDINTTDITYYYVVTAVDTTSNESDYSSQVFSGLYGDFTGNDIVEVNDFAEFVMYWLLENCIDTAGVDLDDDCIVNFDEFAAFAENWLK